MPPTSQPPLRIETVWLPLPSLSSLTLAGSSSISFISSPFPFEIMVYTSAAFLALLKVLQLTQGLSKPALGAMSVSVKNSSQALGAPVLTPVPIVSTSLLVGHTQLDGRSAQDNSCYVEPYTTSSIAESLDPFDQNMATVMRYRQQQSVNLGSWYVGSFISNPSLVCMADTKLGLCTRIG